MLPYLATNLEQHLLVSISPPPASTSYTPPLIIHKSVMQGLIHFNNSRGAQKLIGLSTRTKRHCLMTYRTSSET